MARPSSEAGTAIQAARVVALCLLAIEVLVWGFGITLGVSATADLLGVLIGVASFTFMILTLVAVFLLVRAPRVGVWFGLVLQVAMLALALLFTVMSFIGVFLVIPLAIITALLLAASWPRRPRT